jgi:hypothetical protein
VWQSRDYFTPILFDNYSQMDVLFQAVEDSLRNGDKK